MPLLGTVVKQPIDVIDVVVDFTKFFKARQSDSIVSCVSAADAGITLGTNEISGRRIRQWQSGGADGTSYKVTLTMTSQEGRVKQVEYRVRVRET